MKAKYEKELNKVNLCIETHLFYEEDYQMKMLRQNKITGLAKIECQHINGESIFKYDVSNMLSLKRKYEMMELRCDKIFHLIEGIIKVVEEIQSYFLSPDGLVLDPSLIYWGKEGWSFLYLPVKKSNLSKAFHELTEYLVKTLDYKEAEGIQLASFLHKETLQENFNLKDILSRYEENYKSKSEGNQLTQVEEWEELKEDFSTGIEEHKGINLENVQIVGEQRGEYQTRGEEQEESYKHEEGSKKSRKFFLGKGIESTTAKFRKSRWGDWEDLITD